MKPHVASSYDDTTEGAIHYFQDEQGNWLSYTFSEKVENTISPARMLTVVPQQDSLCTNFTLYNSQEPRQSTSSNQPFSQPYSGVDLNISMKEALGNSKAPSSSESWSSISSTDLALEASKIYPSMTSGSNQRRNMHHRGSQQSSSRNQSQGDSDGPSPIPSMPSLVNFTPEFRGVSVSSHALSSRLPIPYSAHRTLQRNRRDMLQVLTESLRERRRIPTSSFGSSGIGDHGESSLSGIGHDGMSIIGRPHGSGGDDLGKMRRKSRMHYYYKMKVLPCIPKFTVNVWFDRLKLMALFDKNRGMCESFIAIVLAIGVACAGSFLLHKEYYQDLTTCLLCLVIASCQFSLLKSVQPDAASPTHGFNYVVALSRPVYFCICGAFVYLLQTCLDYELYNKELYIYSVDLTQKEILVTCRDGILTLILCFPLFFSIGLFPQFNTFLMYLLEQIEMHGFGGNATSSLHASFICVVRSLLAVGLLYGFAYGGLSEPRATQNVLFSIFCGLLVPTAYHLSRCASDISVMWTVLKQQFCPDEDCFGETVTMMERKEAEEQGDPLPKKLRETVNARLKSDAIICSVIGVVTFSLHSSTVFTALQPGLTLTLWITAIVIGFVLHYLIPQLRKQLPCLLISHPVLPTGEYKQFEVRDAARLMWFEKIFIWLCFFEKNILHPLLFISALTEKSLDLISNEKFGLAFGSLIVVVTGLKAFRSSFSNPTRHYLILFFTILFFHFDWEDISEGFLVDFFFMSIIFHKVYELWLKLQFVITYIAPWQITWGSAFHAFAQPFSVPHSAMLFLQAFISSVFSAPLNPFLGSAIFITSYVRPIKFWERDYNTKRVDHSNTRLSAHLEKNPGADGKLFFFFFLYATSH